MDGQPGRPLEVERRIRLGWRGSETCAWWGMLMQKTEDDWRASLTAEQFRILREHGTEPRGSSPLNKEKRDGRFICAGCGKPLFTSDAKFESGTGWPSFIRPVDERAVETTVDRSFGMTRTEVRCAECGGHLGHVF